MTSNDPVDCFHFHQLQLLKPEQPLQEFAEQIIAVIGLHRPPKRNPTFPQHSVEMVKLGVGLADRFPVFGLEIIQTLPLLQTLGEQIRGRNAGPDPATGDRVDGEPRIAYRDNIIVNESDWFVARDQPAAPFQHPSAPQPDLPLERPEPPFEAQSSSSIRHVTYVRRMLGGEDPARLAVVEQVYTQLIALIPSVDRLHIA